MLSRWRRDSQDVTCRHYVSVQCGYVVAQLSTELPGLSDKSATLPPEDPLLTSYAQLAKGLIGQSIRICLFDAQLRARGCTPGLDLRWVERWVKKLRWVEASARAPEAISPRTGKWLTAIPLEQPDGALLGVFCILEPRQETPDSASQYAADMGRTLKPLLDCVHREMAVALPAKSRIQTLTERSRELEWLFRVTSKLKASLDEKHVLQELIDSAALRLESELAVIYIPSRRLCLERMRSA